jgi:Pyridoxamine 5'-phosphate oxidase
MNTSHSCTQATAGRAFRTFFGRFVGVVFEKLLRRRRPSAGRRRWTKRCLSQPSKHDRQYLGIVSWAVLIFHIDRARYKRESMEETMSEGFTIANFRSVAHGLQEGQFAVGERKKASGLRDLDPKYKRLLDEPVTMTLGLIGPDGRIGLTPMWFDYEGDKILVNTASHRAKCERMQAPSKYPAVLGLDLFPQCPPSNWIAAESERRAYRIERTDGDVISVRISE